MRNTDEMSNQSADLLSGQEQTPPPVDAVIHVLIKSDKLEAHLNIEPPENGGGQPTVKSIEDELKKFRVVYGISHEKIKAIAEKPVYDQNILIAAGVQKVNGTDGTYKILFDTEKNLKPKERSDGTVDYQDLGIVNNVKKGDVLCEITLPTDGTEGIAVTGEKLLPVKGRPVPYLTGKNTELNEQGTAILSTINGQVEFNAGKINVNDTFYINGDVGNSTGSIKVIGNIVVRGMVFSGFSVEAEGSIEISGSVESAVLKSGGNMTLRSGVNGSEMSCGGDLTTRFIENCNATVKGSLKSEYIMNSNIRCGKNLDIAGALARFSGGSCVVGNDLTAPVIGSTSGIKTDLELGTNPDIIERQQTIIKELPVLEKQLGSLKQLVDLLQQLEAANRLDDEKRTKLEEVRRSFQRITGQIESENAELAEINKTIETYGYGRIICRGTIHPGTSIKIGSARLTVTDPLINTIVYSSEGEIFSGPAY
jgi:uncharacterized protein (DUF342 family)